jgi:hypothetical protein
MKAKLSLVIFLLVAMPTITLSAEMPSEHDNVQVTPVSTSVSFSESPVLTNVLAVSSGLPRGPQELLQDYEAEMTAITQRFSDAVAVIADAVHSGKLSSEQGQKISAQQYQMAEMQFELLSAWHEMLEQDLAATAQLERQKQLAKGTTPAR